jgi:hypothetical protein
VLCAGNGGRGFDSVLRDSEDCKDRREVFDFNLLRALNVNPLARESVEQSLPMLSTTVAVDGLSSTTETSLEIDTDIVASPAISRAKVGERGVVVNTTKKGIVEAREKTKELGSVT